MQKQGITLHLHWLLTRELLTIQSLCVSEMKQSYDIPYPGGTSGSADLLPEWCVKN